MVSPEFQTNLKFPPGQGLAVEDIHHRPDSVKLELLVPVKLDLHAYL